MSVLLDLQSPIDEELAERSAREGLSASDHVALLLYVSNAILSEQPPSPFKEAVKAFLASQDLEVERLALAFESLIAACVADEHERPEFAAATVPNGERKLLQAWRSLTVHAPVDIGADEVMSPVAVSDTAIHRGGRTARHGQRSTEVTDPSRATGEIDAPPSENQLAPGSELRHASPGHSVSEAALLETIAANSSLPPREQRRFDALRRRLKAEALTPTETAELQEIWQRVERMNVARLDALANLALRRGVTIGAVMKELGLPEQLDAF